MAETGLMDIINEKLASLQNPSEDIHKTLQVRQILEK